MRIRLSRRRRVFLAVLLLAYIGFCMIGGCADQLILFPSTHPIQAVSATRRIIQVRGADLEIWVAQSPGAAHSEPQAIVVSFIGNADRGEYAAYDAETWGQLPIELWRVNYPGYGGSAGPARLASIGPAALAAFDAAAAHADGRPVFVEGTSLGTTAALHVSSQRQVAGMLLRTPVPLRQVILGSFGWWNLWLLAGPVALGVPAELDSLKNAAATKAPAVFLLIETDEVVPVRYQQRVAEAFAGPSRQVLGGGGHNSPLSAATRRQLGAELGWLWQQAGLTPPAHVAEP